MGQIKELKLFVDVMYIYITQYYKLYNYILETNKTKLLPSKYIPGRSRNVGSSKYTAGEGQRTSGRPNTKAK